jgi:cobalt-zinc-cadmium efflux system protein
MSDHQQAHTDAPGRLHGHAHQHGQAHGGHSHAVSADADRRYLRIALALLLTFMAAEVSTGIIAHSLALLSDAGHMLTDAAAIGLSLIVLRLAARPATEAMTFGLKRTEILSAQLNGATLAVLATWIVYEAVRHLISPPAVNGELMLIVALTGVAVNLAATWALSRANRQNLSIEGSFQHVLTDLYAFIATAIAAAVILTTGFDRADGIASLIIAASMLRSAYGLIRDSGRILLEGAPSSLPVQEIGTAIARQPAVSEVHDLHVWEIGSDFPALAAHILVPQNQDCHTARRQLENMLRERFAIEHTTLQVDHEPGQLIQLQTGPLAC